MIHKVDAIYDQGVFRPVVPVGLSDGTPVHLRVEEDNGKLAESSERTTSYSVWLDRLAGRWHGDFVRGDEGDVEAREPLS